MVVLNERYLLRRMVGRGGMAIVWEAQDLLLERTVAVKMLSDALSSGPSTCDYVRREAVAAGRLNHPHVASVHDYGEHIDVSGAVRPYLVLEFVDGATLTAHLSRHGPLPWPDALRVGSAVAEALAAAHAEGIVYRHVKPGNVMLGPAGVKVVDFGVAGDVGQSATDAAGVQWGTPAYLAPEYVRDATATPAGDVFALGLLLITMLSGRVPDREPGDDVDVRLLLPDRHVLPASVRQVLSRCLATDPGIRPAAAAAAGAMRDALTAVVQEDTTDLTALTGRPTVRRATQPELTAPGPGLVGQPRPRRTAALSAIGGRGGLRRHVQRFDVVHRRVLGPGAPRWTVGRRPRGAASHDGFGAALATGPAGNPAHDRPAPGPGRQHRGRVAGQRRTRNGGGDGRNRARIRGQRPAVHPRCPVMLPSSRRDESCSTGRSAFLHR